MKIKKQKGLNSIISFVIVVLIATVATSLVLTASRDTIDTATGTTEIKDAEGVLRMLDNAILEVVSEGNGSSRLVEISTVGSFRVLPDEDAIEYETQDATGFEYLSRVFQRNIAYVAGNDVSCESKDADGDGDDDLVLENTFIRAVFNAVNKTANGTQINTTNNIISITEKKDSDTVIFSDSSVFIDGSSSVGTGYSEIQKADTQMPVCTAHFFVNSTVDYDVFYRLYAGADFITAEVRVR